MKVTIKAEYTGKNDYFDYNDNLLIKAIEDKGYRNVYLQQGEWNGEKTYLWGTIKRKEEGRITAKANGQIRKLSLYKFDQDTVIDLEQE